jgi:hypothetical protein
MACIIDAHGVPFYNETRYRMFFTQDEIDTLNQIELCARHEFPAPIDPDSSPLTKLEAAVEWMTKLQEPPTEAELVERDKKSAALPKWVPV